MSLRHFDGVIPGKTGSGNKTSSQNRIKPHERNKMIAGYMRFSCD